MRGPLSTDTLLSLGDRIDPEAQIEHTKSAIRTLPQIATSIRQVLYAAPYLLAVYTVYGLIDFVIQFTPATASSDVTTLTTILIASGAITLTYIETYNTLSGKPLIQTPWKHALLTIPQLIISTIATAVVILAGLAMFIVPGAYLSVRLLVTLPATVLQDGGIRDGFKQSFTATKGQLTLIMVIGGVGTLLATTIVSGVVLTEGTIRLSFAFLLSGPFQLLTHISLAIVYLDGTESNILPSEPRPTLSEDRHQQSE